MSTVATNEEHFINIFYNNIMTMRRNVDILAITKSLCIESERENIP